MCLALYITVCDYYLTEKDKLCKFIIRRLGQISLMYQIINIEISSPHIFFDLNLRFILTFSFKMRVLFLILTLALAEKKHSREITLNKLSQMVFRIKLKGRLPKANTVTQLSDHFLDFYLQIS